MPDSVTVTHPDLPGVKLVKPRKRAESMTRNGWKIAKPKSSTAPAVEETNTPDTGNHNPEEGLK